MEKWFFLIFETWIISLIILLSIVIIGNTDLDIKLVIKSLFPTTFANNWFITCYILVYPMYPLLNPLISKLSRKAHLRTCAFLLFVFVFLSTFYTFLFYTDLLLWLTLIFVVSYYKKYGLILFDKMAYRTILFIVCFMGLLVQVVATLFFANNYSFFSEKIFLLRKNCNVFIVFLSLSLFVSFTKKNFSNKIINQLSKQSLLIYILHENILLRTYFRPKLFIWLQREIGYNHIVLWVLFFSFVIFLVCMVLSLLYDYLLKKIFKRISDKLYRLITNVLLFIERKVLTNNKED